MARQKKIKSIKQEQPQEVNMTEAAVLESLESEIDLKRQELEAIKKELEEKKAEAPRRVISEDEKFISDKHVSMNNEKAALKAKIEKQKAYDSVMITGRFHNRHHPGKKSEKLTYMKYDTDPVKWYDFEDGKVYTIPRGFADQLNGGTDTDPCYYKPHFIKKTADEFQDPNKPCSAISNVDTSNKKYAFVPLNF